MASELSIPPAALENPSVEMIRVWLANARQHVVLNIGLWEDRGIDERSAWGILLADMIHHIASAHESEYGRECRETIEKVRRAFEAELDNPTTERIGEFVKERREPGN